MGVLRRRRVARAAVVALAAGVALAGCGGGSGKSKSGSGSTSTGAAPTASKVTIVNFKYGPPSVTVRAGSRLTFVNQDTAEHTATADNGSFDSGTLQPGGASKTVTVTKTGTIAYHCQFHPFMHGTVVVR
jgi:plastocyanin